MTREEAIAFFRDMNECTYGNLEAVEMAIKALEPKPYEKFESAKDHIYKLAGDYKCWDNRLTKDEAVELCHILEQQPCEDAVSRKTVLNTLNRMDSVLDEGRTVETYKELLIACYNDLPSVTPAPKKGKWIDTDVTLLNRQGYIVHEVICSECNGISYFRKMGNKYIGANLCPNCGCFMSKGGKE